VSGRTTSALRRLSNADQAQLARQLDRLFAAIASEAANNPDFAAEVTAAFQDTSPPKSRQARATSNSPKSATGRARAGRRPPGPFDPHEVHAAEGGAALRSRLDGCTVDELKNIIAQHGMDHDRLAMKWKTPERLIERIVSTVESQAEKGNAFR
jgi:hypothetical protein